MSTTSYVGPDGKTYTLNDYLNEPWYSTERQLQTDMIDAIVPLPLPSDDVAYANAHLGFSTVKDALDYLTYTLPTVTASVTQAVYEKGQTATSEVFSWVPVYSTDTLNAVTITGVGGVPVATTSHTYSDTLTTNKTYTVLIADNKANTASASATVYFDLYKYYGQSASATPTQTIIKAAASGSSILSIDSAGSQATSVAAQAGGGNYIYFAYPQSWGALSSITVNGFGSTWNQTVVSVTNASSHTENYYCYTSPNTIAGTVSLSFA